MRTADQREAEVNVLTILSKPTLQVVRTQKKLPSANADALQESFRTCPPHPLVAEQQLVKAVRRSRYSPNLEKELVAHQRPRVRSYHQFQNPPPNPSFSNLTSHLSLNPHRAPIQKMNLPTHKHQENSSQLKRHNFRRQLRLSFNKPKQQLLALPSPSMQEDDQRKSSSMSRVVMRPQRSMQAQRRVVVQLQSPRPLGVDVPRRK